ncbi:hypothetical protein J6O48_09220 [bacterium]|nr:hypothetical protein [bacterium]
MTQNFKIKLGKRHSKDRRIVTLEELKNEFAKELKTAVDNYSEHEEYKDKLSGKYKTGNYEEDFYYPQNIRFNFNSYVNSVWYIENIL